MLFSEKRIKEISPVEYPYIEEGDKVATFEARNGKKLFGAVIASHPFDGDDFRCGKTGERYTGIWNSSTWETAKLSK